MVQALIGLRKTSAALRHGDWRPVWSEEAAFAYIRQASSGERVLVAINRGDATVTIHVRVATAHPEVLWGHVELACDDETLTLRDLEPWSGAVVRL
jgi:hypothetical protein